MKKLFLSLLMAFVMPSFTMLAQQSPVSFGESSRLNEGWLFQLADDSAAVNTDYNDSRWQRVHIPHDWSVSLPMSPDRGSCQGYLPGGIGWYRCHFSPDSLALSTGKRIYIYFEGVYNRSTVYLNGVKLGYRPSGFASFLYELTPHLNRSGDNVLAVRVDHSRQNDSRWYTGSGINRNVWIISAPEVHLAQWGSAWRVKKLSGGNATVEVDVQATAGGADYAAIVEIYDASGKVVGTAKVKIPSEQRQTATVQIKNTQLWTLANPYLYKIVTRLQKDGNDIDRSVVSLGIRTLTFSPDRGFALNGKWMKVKGVCLHDDAGVLGTAVPAAVWRTRLQTLKSLGVNAIRMSHNPHAPMVYELCDSLGLLVMDEASDEWEFPKRKWLKGWNQGTPGFEGTFDYFEEWIDRDVADMVRRDRCHPSIFMWSIGNEVDYPNDPYSHPVLNGDKSMTQPIYGGFKSDAPRAERIGEIAKRLSKIVRGIDFSRAVTGALAGVVMSNETAYPEAVDVVGYNYTESRYGEDHAKYPKRVIYGSENRHDLAAWRAVTDNEHIFGQFLWTGIDYLGESGPWPARGSEAGLLDLAGQIKPNGYYRASLWSETPMCYIGTYPQMQQRGRRNNAGGYVSQYAPAVWNYEIGQRVRVVCYTNAPSAHLLLNGSPIGGEPKRDEATNILYWDVEYAPGTLRCEVDGASAEIATTGRPYALRVTADKKQLAGNGDVVQILVEVVDEDGKVVTLADNEISCRVQGNARLLGMENGDIRDTRDKNQPRCRVKNGRLVAYIAKGAMMRNARNNGTVPAWDTDVRTGTIRIYFSSPLLQGQEISL